MKSHPYWRRVWHTAGLLLLCLGLLSCSGIDADGSNAADEPGIHVVKRGETLMSIARDHDADFRELAAANKLKPPYAIEVGQRLRLPEAGRYHVVASGETLYSIAWKYGLDYRRLAAANGIAPPYTIRAGQRLRVKGISLPEAPEPARPSAHKGVAKASQRPSRAATAALPTSAPEAGSEPKPVNVSREPWLWPATGKVLARFSASGTVNKGIDIAGQRGQAVQSARSGKVVYAGTGIAGYGQLVIVKHDDLYLSAYAHNERLLVVEGQDIQAGQKIAEMGDNGTDQVLLHFEIRKEGQPVDPMSLLPAR